MLPLLLPAGVANAAEIKPVIVDTDIGDDIDDAFALALLLRAPEVSIEAVTTSFGNTTLRTRLVRRLLHQAGRDDIAVGTGPSTADSTRFTQAAWALTRPAAPAPDAVALLLERLRAAPTGSITLIAIAPLSTIGAAIARDPATFRRVRQVILMGGSVRRGYGKVPGTTSATPGNEYNIHSDPGDFRRLIESGVAVVLMPLDATEVALPLAMRRDIFGQPDPADRALAALYAQWAANNPWGPVPVLFDVVPVAWLLDPSVCHPVPIRLAVLDSGATIEQPGAANVHACLDVDRARVLGLLTERLKASPSAR
ncbi:nucleoside hydrolase [Lichenicoccus sp.]|uniref:nucleoside hydrolase n=1 Tax=Lichenicoccus sp. TaxID=2781899 RepID=UPI003D12DFDC